MANETKTLEWMREIWAQENERCFNGKLPKPYFRVTNMPNDLGEWHVTKTNAHRIRINRLGCKTKKEVRRIMLHEMIHQLQYLQKSKRTQCEHHGRFFRDWCIKIFCITGIMPY